MALNASFKVCRQILKKLSVPPFSVCPPFPTHWICRDLFFYFWKLHFTVQLHSQNQPRKIKTKNK
jgi:hypothetical protein